MLVRSLYLKNFRLYDEAVYHFPPSLNSIYGPNASGKTTIVEALFFLATGRSFRTSCLKELIRKGEKHFIVELIFEKRGVSQRIKVVYNGREKHVFYNSHRLTSSTSSVGLLHGVLFVPDDANMIKGAPRQRRLYLDLQIAQVDPLYGHHMHRYQRAMRQRNQLLKNRMLRDTLPWEVQMAKSASYLVRKRRSTLEKLEVLSQGYFRKISEERETLSLHYDATVPAEDEEIISYYLDTYAKNCQKEMILGCTLAGPHRDDIRLCIDEKEAKQYASEGQKQSVIAALKLAEWKGLTEAEQTEPLLLIDDFGVSLDHKRQSALLSILSEHKQTFLTSVEQVSPVLSERR